MKKLNILMISTACAPTTIGLEATYGGIEAVLKDFIIPLSKEGHEITVAAPQGSTFPEKVHHFATVKLPEQIWREEIAASLLFQQNLIPDSFDIIHDFSHQKLCGRISHGYWAKPHPFLFMVWHPAKFGGLPNYIHEPAYNLCGLGKYHAATLSKLYNQEVKWGYLGMDTGRYALKKDKGSRYLFCSVPSRQKGVLEAIGIAKELELEMDLVCGALPSEGQDYVNLCKSECDGKKLKWVGGVPESEKIKYMQEAKGLIFPVLQDEPFGLVMAEAMSCGTPVFALNHGSPAEVVGEDGGYVADSLEELKVAVRDHSKGEDVYDPDACRSRAVLHFDRKVMVKNYKKIYGKIIDGEHWY